MTRVAKRSFFAQKKILLVALSRVTSLDIVFSALPSPDEEDISVRVCV